MQRSPTPETRFREGEVSEESREKGRAYARAAREKGKQKKYWANFELIIFSYF
jgi:hypothetical protein